MYLIMELCRGGELSDLLRKKGYFREQACAALGGMITVRFVQEWVGGATINLVELSNLFSFTRISFTIIPYAGHICNSGS